MEARNVKERSGGKRGFECGGHAHFPAPRICMGEDQWLSGGDVRGWERGGIESRAIATRGRWNN